MDVRKLREAVRSADSIDSCKFYAETALSDLAGRVRVLFAALRSQNISHAVHQAMDLAEAVGADLDARLEGQLRVLGNEIYPRKDWQDKVWRRIAKLERKPWYRRAFAWIWRSK